MKNSLLLLLIFVIGCKEKISETKSEERVSTSEKKNSTNFQYKSRQGNFTINFPGKPEEDSAIVESKYWGQIKTHALYYDGRKSNDPNIIYGISYDLLPRKIKSDSIDFFLEEEVQMALSNSEGLGKIISDNKIQYGKFPGREVHIELTRSENESAISIQKYIIVDKVSYYIGVTTLKQNYPNKSLFDFINSFKADSIQQ